MDNAEKDLADLTAAYYRREIGRLMQQAEHWKEEGKPLAVHIRLHRADSYYQVVSLMERTTREGKSPFDEMRRTLARPEVDVGAYPWTKDMLPYYEPVGVAAMMQPAASDPRIAALEAALVEVARLFDDGSSSDWEGCAEVRAILARVGLADRLPGNPHKAEEAVAS